MPLWPYFLYLNGDFISSPVRRSVRTEPPGSGWPSYFSSAGLGSKQSMSGAPAIHEEKNDAFHSCGMIEHRLAACSIRVQRFPGRELTDSPNMPAKAIMPKPLPTRRKASRRVIGLSDLCV